MTHTDEVFEWYCEWARFDGSERFAALEAIIADRNRWKAEVERLKGLWAKEAAKNFQYEAEKAEPGITATRLAAAEAEVERLKGLMRGWTSYAWKDGEYIDSIQGFFDEHLGGPSDD